MRSTRDPWATLVAEVMSQQTQIARIAEPWRAFVTRWPDPASLAEAPTDELLRAWAGLGYNRRALALRDAARRLVSEHDGRVPAEVEALERLPGVGPYTARAVAASSFGVPAAPLDVNVRRVVARVLGLPGSARDLQRAADELVTRDDPRRWVHALMDLAVTVCLRRSPACGACPIASFCAAAGTEGDLDGSAPARAARRGQDTAGDRRDRASAGIRFEHTRRWLRGRIVARLREVGAGTWLEFDEPIGVHAVAEVRAALLSLEADGFIEAEASRARLR